MIEFVHGDMFATPADIRVNTVNCVGVMGAGVALAFKQRYPEMFKAYERDCKQGLVQPGKIHVWRSLSGDWVINFPTKRHWKDESRYEDIDTGLDALRAYLETVGHVCVTLPALGCGHGGLEWDQVSKMIEHKLDGVQARIRVFAPIESHRVGRVAAEEPTADEIRSAEEFGFEKLSSSQFEPFRSARAVFTKGDVTGLSKRWIAILPAKEPGERELKALDAVASELSRDTAKLTVALLHASQVSEKIAQIFVYRGINVVILLPFGVLTRKSVARLASSNNPGTVTLVSVARPGTKWNRTVFAQTAEILREHASAALVSDPNPDWLIGRVASSWRQARVFYLRYDGQSERTRSLLADMNALPIGRRSETGAPNVESLLFPYRAETTASVSQESRTVQQSGWAIEHKVPATSPSAGLEDRPVPAINSGVRRLLFISHANPQDNAAALWFATQLTLMGYDVWCDLKNTHAGESNFWLKVQKKIEDEAAKFLFILSNNSRDFEKKSGIYKEVQAADDLKRDNFILPLRIEKLTGSVPIILSPDLHINTENWAEGLRELQRRLVHDGVPRMHEPDYDKITSWWPALGAREALVRNHPEELVSNILRFTALPTTIHFLKVSADGNPLIGSERLRGALPSYPTHSAHGQHAISFASAEDFTALVAGYEISDDIVLPTEDFLSLGCDKLSILPQTAQNITTYLIATALEKFLSDKGLSYKALRNSRRRMWFPADGLIKNNNHSYSDGTRRRAPAWFVGTISHFRKKYFWHFAIQPAIDLHTHRGILLSPKAIISAPYRSDWGEKAHPLDEKRVLKKINWWNKEWRSKLLSFTAWLADDRETIRVPVGYQEILLSANPATFTSNISYVEKDDDALLKAIMD